MRLPYDNCRIEFSFVQHREGVGIHCQLWLTGTPGGKVGTAPPCDCTTQEVTSDTLESKQKQGEKTGGGLAQLGRKKKNDRKGRQLGNCESAPLSQKVRVLFPRCAREVEALPAVVNLTFKGCMGLVLDYRTRVKC